MVRPSIATTIGFVAICLALAVLLVLAVARAVAHEPATVRRRWVLGTAAGALVWLAATGSVSASGVLEIPMVPPPITIFFVLSMAAAIVAAYSPLGTRIVDGVPIAALVLFQSFRLPLELVLHRWYVEGVLPRQMTFEGHNFDIITGVLALFVGVLVWRKPSARLVWAFNVVGFALLVTVATIAVLSSPVPLRTYWNDPPVLLAFHFPYGWIVPICVGGALFGHLVVFRGLVRRRTSVPRHA